MLKISLPCLYLKLMQGYYCGSCYAFCPVVVLEALKYLQQSAFILTSLSEQQIVDCTLGAPYYNWGCDYGWVENVRF